MALANMYLELELSLVSNMASISVSPITDVAWTDLLLVCFSVCPLLCQRPQQWCIQLLGQGCQSPHLNHWRWQCWQCIQLFQLAEMVDRSQSKPSCLMEGEWGPTDKGSFVVVDPYHLRIAQLGSGSWVCRWWRLADYRCDTGDGHPCVCVCVCVMCMSMHVELFAPAWKTINTSTTLNL